MKKIKFAGLFYGGPDGPPVEKEIEGILAVSGLAVTAVVGKNAIGGDMKAWNISHINSGLKMFHDYFKTRKFAIEVAKELSIHVDWDTIKTSKYINCNPSALGAYQKTLGKLKINDYGIYTGWKY